MCSSSWKSITALRFFAIAALLSACATGADTEFRLKQLYFESRGQETLLLEYATGGRDSRPAVLLLHGASGFDRFQSLYDRHSSELAANGLRVYVVMYYTSRDLSVMTGDNRENRQRHYRERFASWVETCVAALDFVSELPGTDRDNIAILGFSQGAYIAVGVAGTDHRVAALVEKYGGLPSAMTDEIDRLPPTLIIHGDADRVVPVSEAYSLATFLDGIGAHYEIEIYKDAGHGFDGIQGSTDALDAVERTVDFLKAVLQQDSE